jgi:hypothetical protein
MRTIFLAALLNIIMMNNSAQETRSAAEASGLPVGVEAPGFTQSDESQRLPIPATYIIGRDGVIAWRQLDPDYKNRSSVKEIISNLPEQD